MPRSLSSFSAYGGIQEPSHVTVSDIFHESKNGTVCLSRRQGNAKESLLTSNLLLTLQ